MTLSIESKPQTGRQAEPQQRRDVGRLLPRRPDPRQRGLGRDHQALGRPGREAQAQADAPRRVGRGRGGRLRARRQRRRGPGHRLRRRAVRCRDVVGPGRRPGAAPDPGERQARRDRLLARRADAGDGERGQPLGDALGRGHGPRAGEPGGPPGPALVGRLLPRRPAAGRGLREGAGGGRAGGGRPGRRDPAVGPLRPQAQAAGQPRRPRITGSSRWPSPPTARPWPRAASTGP